MISTDFINFIALFLLLVPSLAECTPAAIIVEVVRDSDRRQPHSVLEKRFPPISPDDAGSGPHVSRTVARYIVIVVLIFVFLMGSLLLLRKCRPTFPRSRRATSRLPTPTRTTFPMPAAFGHMPKQHSKRDSKSSMSSDMSDTSTVVANELHYLPSPSALSKPPNAYTGGGKINLPAVGSAYRHAHQ